MGVVEFGKLSAKFCGCLHDVSCSLKKHLDRSDLGKGGLLWLTGQGIHTVCLAGSQAGESLKQLVTSYPVRTLDHKY